MVPGANYEGRWASEMIVVYIHFNSIQAWKMTKFKVLKSDKKSEDCIKPHADLQTMTKHLYKFKKNAIKL